ncbi:uncharacterized mitochondrial protein AtMg00810-like [Jatropha curcas]|uniref:uncharacterized mitochondrial protein AtMg00810-like n=1 Tax=Jatropha curcas TaxID=180498 RepID=UPI0018950D15|nr:uncharacterized mitochondrial protein AtMg00810-like [Jatropha curcas]
MTSVEFDPFGFTVKDNLLRCDSTGDLYPITNFACLSMFFAPSAFSAISLDQWHNRLGHPGIDVIKSLRHSDGSFERHKARLVGDGRSQRAGIDYDETFSLVVKPATIRIVLSLAVPRAWYQRFTHYVASIDFIHSQMDNSLFIYNSGSDTAYLLLYVDDIILITSSDDLRKNIIARLNSEFAMKDLGPLHYFLGIVVHRTPSGLFLTQYKYASKILEHVGMTNCKPSLTPVDTAGKMSAQPGPLCSDPQKYRQLAGALQYLTFTRPDICYVVQQVCLFMHSPTEQHMNALKRILHYIKGTIHYGLSLSKSPKHSLVFYMDADWGGCPDTRRSTSGYCVFLGSNIISWSSKRRPTISKSSAEAEYRGVANVVSESCWLRNLLLELHCPSSNLSLL